jgi:hypothetical protein
MNRIHATQLSSSRSLRGILVQITIGVAFDKAWVIHASTLDKDENAIVRITNDLHNVLDGTELRRRFAIVHTERYVHIVRDSTVSLDVRTISAAHRSGRLPA